MKVGATRVETSLSNAKNAINHVNRAKTENFLKHAGQTVGEKISEIIDKLESFGKTSSFMKRAAAASLMAVAISISAVAPAQAFDEKNVMLDRQEIQSAIEKSKDSYELTCLVGQMMVDKINAELAKDAQEEDSKKLGNVYSMLADIRQ